MDDIANQKYDIDRKLEKEMTNLEILRESLKKSSTNTQNMLDILTSFESRLQRLEDTIVPVYNETENLRRRQENIEKTLHTVDNVLGYYHAAKDVETVIREGPSAIDLDTYISYMDKLLRAMRYFNTNNPSSKELDQLTRIYDDGKEALQHEFRSLLTRHGRPVPPIVIMDLLGTDEELPPIGTDTDLFALEHLPEKVVEQLSDISKWLVANDSSSEFTKYYSTARAAMLMKSLQVLQEHLKTSSGSSNSHVGQHSPAMTNKFRGTKDTPGRKSMKKMAFKPFKKSSTLKAGRSPFEQGHRRQGSSTESIKEEQVDVETDQYITQLTALLRLMQSESHLMNGIIPEKYQRNVFDNTVQQALDMIVNEGERLAQTAKRNMGRHEFSAVLSIFPIVKHLRLVRPEFDLILEGCQAPTRSKLVSLLSTLDSTGAKALEDFNDSVRNDSEKFMPKDGTVHELANKTIIFLEQLQDYAETAGAMLLMHGEQAAPSQSAITPDACRLRLADYMTRVLSALGLNLTNKAEMYTSDPALKPIFMLNNYHYILKSLRRTKLIDLLHAWNPKVTEFYEDQITKQKQTYSESWNKVLHFIMEVDKPISVQRTQNSEVIKLKDKDRQNIKDRFTGFNKELEEIYKIQKGYAIPDAELRESLKADNKKYISLRYEVFLNKYKPLNFTKNPQKYIKYDVAGVQELIDKFFDAAA